MVQISGPTGLKGSKNKMEVCSPEIPEKYFLGHPVDLCTLFKALQKVVSNSKQSSFCRDLTLHLSVAV